MLSEESDMELEPVAAHFSGPVEVLKSDQSSFDLNRFHFMSFHVISQGFS